MGRPPTITGQIMSAHAIEVELLIQQLQRQLVAALTGRSTDPVHYIAAIGDALALLSELDLAHRNIMATLQANGEVELLTADPVAVVAAAGDRVRRLVGVEAGP